MRQSKSLIIPQHEAKRARGGGAAAKKSPCRAVPTEDRETPDPDAEEPEDNDDSADVDQAPRVRSLTPPGVQPSGQRPAQAAVPPMAQAGSKHSSGATLSRQASN